jgi:hypothetical protein
MKAMRVLSPHSKFLIFLNFIIAIIDRTIREANIPLRVTDITRPRKTRGIKNHLFFLKNAGKQTAYKADRSFTLFIRPQ